MNRIFIFADRFNTVETIEPKNKDKFEDVKDPNDALLDLIFGVDPATGLPCGDLSVYLGKNANPEIKMYIENQLLTERHDSAEGVSMPTEVVNKFGSLSDDDVAMFSRNHGESKEEYADRIRLFLASEKEKRARDKKQKEIDNLLHGAKS